MHATRNASVVQIHFCTCSKRTVSPAQGCLPSFQLRSTSQFELGCHVRSAQKETAEQRTRINVKRAFSIVGQDTGVDEIVQALKEVSEVLCRTTVASTLQLSEIKW